MKKMCFLTVESVVYVRKTLQYLENRLCDTCEKKMKMKQNTERYEIQRKRRKRRKKEEMWNVKKWMYVWWPQCGQVALKSQNG